MKCIYQRQLTQRSGYQNRLIWSGLAVFHCYWNFNKISVSHLRKGPHFKNRKQCLQKTNQIKTTLNKKNKTRKFGALFRGKASEPGLDLLCVIIQSFCDFFFSIFFYCTLGYPLTSLLLLL